MSLKQPAAGTCWAILGMLLWVHGSLTARAQLAQPQLQPQLQRQLSQGQSTQSQASTLKSDGRLVTFNDCPVILENRYVVPARENGIVAEVHVEQNAAVKRDQLLLSLDKDQAESELQTAKKAQAIAVDAAVDDSDLELRKFALRQAEEELNSYSEIAKSISASELRRLKLAVASAKVSVINAERMVKRLGMQAELAANAVEEATMHLANREVHAPSAGIVTEVLVRNGQYVEVGKPVMVVSDLSQLQVDCLIPIEKIDLSKLVGLDVRVESNHRTARGTPTRLSGRVTSYDPKLSAQGEIRVHCRIQNAQQDGHWVLLPEMNVRLEIAVPASQSNETPALISRRPKS